MTPYQRFRALHVPGAPLVLANAWDVASARLIEAEGAVAVATTSAGIAWSFGVPDGGALDRGRAIDVVRRIVTAVDVPVTADVEERLLRAAGAEDLPACQCLSDMSDVGHYRRIPAQAP